MYDDIKEYYLSKNSERFSIDDFIKNFDDIYDHLTKARFSFCIPYQYINIEGQMKVDAMIINCGIMNPTTTHRSLRAFIKTDNILGQALDYLKSINTTFNKSLISIHNTYLNIKVQNILTTQFDGKEYDTFEELLNAYSLDDVITMDSNPITFYKTNIKSKYAISLKEPIDLTHQTNQPFKNLRILYNTKHADNYKDCEYLLFEYLLGIFLLDYTHEYTNVIYVFDKYHSQFKSYNTNNLLYCTNQFELILSLNYINDQMDDKNMGLIDSLFDFKFIKRVK